MIYLLECIMVYLMVETFLKFLKLIVNEYPKKIIVKKWEHVIEFTVQFGVVIYYLTIKGN